MSALTLMARMTFCDARGGGRDPRTLSVVDPCVGSGRMLLHASNHSLNLWGQDVDPLAVALCKVNGALSAPWLAFPLPASVLGREAGSPPGPLPLPEPPEGLPALRVDDRSQGLLFDP